MGLRGNMSRAKFEAESGPDASVVQAWRSDCLVTG